MPTLSIVRTDFGKLAKWGGIALAILIALYIIIRILLVFKDILFPPPPPTPTATFGMMKEPSFPEGVKKNFTFEIETISGDLPILPALSNVYKMELRGPDILAVENASQRAASIKFDYNPQQISDFEYKWTNPNPPVQNLTIDTRLNKFNLTSSYINYEDKIKLKNFSEKQEAVTVAQNFLGALGMYPEDVDEEKIEVEYSILDGGVLRPSSRVVTSNIATIYFYQKPIEEVPIVYPQTPKSTMKVTVATLDHKGEVIDANFSHQNILVDQSATYPLKTAEEAYEDLKKGNAYVLSHNGEDKNVKITDVYIALYNPGELQEFLTPVIVFEGNNNFLAYVPAITDELTDK